MSLLRTIGYIGIALLSLIAAFGLFITLSSHDWYGLFLMVCLAAILIFFAHGLRSAAQRESNPALKIASDLGWGGEPLSALFRGPILHTPEGLIMLSGVLACLLFALLSFFAPAWIGVPPSRSAISTTMFGLWPICLFICYIRTCAPNFQTSVYSSVLVLCYAGFPFYLVFK